MIDLYSLSVILFFAVLAIVIYKDRKNIDFKYILFMRKTKRFRNLIDRIAKISPKFWSIIANLAIIVCFVTMAIGVYIMLKVSYLVFVGIIKEPALQFVFPIPSQNVVVAPGFVGIPFWFWIVVIATILIPHETFHGIIARTEKIKLKDVGLLLLAIFPGAFVEPEEKQLEKSKLKTKLRIFSAGSFINIVIGLVIIVLVQFFIWSPNVHGVLITSVNETSPAAYLGLKPGMVIESINHKNLEINFFDYSLLTLTLSKSNSEDMTKYISNIILFSTLSNFKPGDTITLKINKLNYNLTLAEHPEYKNFPYIGITSKVSTNDVSMFNTLFPLLGMISSLNLAVAMFNILPIYPLDGGLIIKAITDKYAKKKSKKIYMAITYFILLIIIYSVVGGFIRI
jgi:membrane-associated protease RseP (regulator of RpoE activity)